MPAIFFNADLPHYYDAGVPVSDSDNGDPAGLHDPLLPKVLLKQKSAAQTEIDRHAYYFKVADDAKARLEERGLWVEKKKDSGVEKQKESGVYEARPDARERLKDSFSEFLTSFISFGTNNEVAKPMDLASGLVSSCIGGATVVTGLVFAFNTIVSGLKKAFPAHNSHFDQAGKLCYQLTSAIHSLAATTQAIVHQLIPFQSNEIILGTLVTIEILLGLYAMSTATEATLAKNLKKSEILSSLINNRAKAEIVFNKSRDSLDVTKEEADAYDEFMNAISKLDQTSEETSFGILVAATTFIKESLWWSGSVTGNETAYKNLSSVEIGISEAELVGTALGETVSVLIANVIDAVHGVVVYRRYEKRIDHARGIRTKITDLFKKTVLPTTQNILKGLARVIDKKIQDESFEKGFSVVRIMKALPLIVFGIVAVVLLASAAVYMSPVFLAGGIITGVFFFILIARTLRTANGTIDEKIEKDAFDTRKDSNNGLINKVTYLAESPENKFFMLRALAVLLVDQENSQKGEYELDLIFSALDFNEIEIKLLKSFARIKENSEESIKLIEKQLTRMLNLKIFGA